MALGNDGAAGGANVNDFLGAGAGGDTGAGGDGGAGAGGDAGGDAGAGGAVDPDWFGNLSANAEGDVPSNRDYVKAKGFKDIDGLVNSYRGAEKALHDTGRVKVPGEGASEAEVKAFRTAIGVPDDVAGYTIEPPKGADGEVLKGVDGEPVKLSPVLERLAAKALEAGVPAEGYKAIVNEFVQSQLEELGTLDARLNEEAAGKVKEWGDKAPANQAAVTRAIEALGMSREQVLSLRQAWGAGPAMDMLAKLGNGLSEDVMTNGDGGARRFGMTEAQAKARYDQIKADPVMSAKIMVPGSPERAEYERLNDILGEAANRKFAAAQ
ncbi:hypothetical protein [Novosphingobium sp.]|uniref:hypothetical protein n=1 Tax=Novosphingobium sp. TaxID=1874826 RepID=UPI00286E9DA2|nr:hypothetical protein [Novosphingobium sp.]